MTDLAKLFHRQWALPILVSIARKKPLTVARQTYHDTLAETQFQRGETAKAIETIKKAVELRPNVNYFRAQLKRFEAGDASTPPPEPAAEDFEQ